jgi:hypothetical protein
MVMSAITAADEAFAVLAARPAPLAFDASGIPGLPDRHLDLNELRDLLARSTGAAPALDTSVVDQVWRRLGGQARSWGPAWVVAAVGVATPGLTLLARRLTAGRPELVEDVDSEVVAGLLEALRTGDLDASRVWLRLLWAAWRAGNRVRQARETVDLPDDLPVTSSTPRVPYGHPDLLLGRAVAAGILTPYEADLIGDTRIGDTLIEVLATQQGLSAPVLRMRRHRAEQVLVAALHRGAVTEVVLGARPRRDRETAARRNGLPTGADHPVTARPTPPGQAGPSGPVAGCQTVSGRVRNPRVRPV